MPVDVLAVIALCVVGVRVCARCIVTGHMRVCLVAAVPRHMFVWFKLKVLQQQTALIAGTC